MTQEAFIEILKERGYSYRIEGNKIIVTYNGAVYLGYLPSIPPGVEFKNGGTVDLESLTSLPHDVVFRNGRDIYLRSLASLPPDVEFKNTGYVASYQGFIKGDVYLESLTSLPPGVEFRNGGYVVLPSLTSLPSGVVFKNGEDVYLGYLIGRWLKEWKGNIEGIDPKRLLNVMIKQGVFI